MTKLDDKLVPKIGTLINVTVGTDATFKVVTSGGVYDTSTSTATAEVTSDVVQKVTPPQPYSGFLVDGDMIQSGDVKTLIAAEGLTFTPLVTQRVVFGGKVWRIIAVDPIRSGDLVCAYELQLRHGP